jgi:circadian clock protein KaiC
VLYASFDEPANQIIRNLRSVGSDLGPHVDEGLLRIYSVRTEVRSAEEHMVVLQKLIREYEPAVLVIDPISALTKSGGHLTAIDTAIRLLGPGEVAGHDRAVHQPGRRAWHRRGSDGPAGLDAGRHVAARRVRAAGRRAQPLAVHREVAGDGALEQVRELVLGREGTTLADVYVEGGDVLMGTARYEKEAAARRDEENMRQEAVRRRMELDVQRAAVASEIEALRRQLDAQTAEIELIDREQADWRTQRTETRDEIRRRRAGTGRPHAVSGGAQDVP